MQYELLISEENFRSNPVPPMEPTAHHGVEGPLFQSNSPQRRAKAAHHRAYLLTLRLRRMALFANLSFGTGKDSIMTATRPPGGSVFLVEDEVMIRMMVADMLEELGYRVAAEAGEINAAIRLAQPPEF